MDNQLLTPDELAAIAEREAKATPPVLYFVNSPDTGFDEYPTLKEALDAAEETISYFRDEAIDGWNEEVTSIRVGIITHDVEQFDVKHRKDCGEDENWDCPNCDETCDYRMSSDGDLLTLLNIARADIHALLRHIASLEARTPAPATDVDALLAEAAQKVVHARKKLSAICNGRESFTMRIPADRTYDHDFAFADAFDVCDDLAAALRESRALARRWAKHENTWRCFHCGFVATTIEQARDHFGDRDDERPVCVDTAPVSYVDALLADAEHWARLTRKLTSDVEQGCAHVLRLATALRESRAREVAEPYRHALEQRLICSNLPLLTGNADADLMRFVFQDREIALSPEAGVIAELWERAEQAEAQLALCAENTTAAELAQEVECLKAEKEALRAALGKIAARDTGYDRKKVDNLINSDNGDEVAEGAEMGEAHACGNFASAALAIGGEAAQ